MYLLLLASSPTDIMLGMSLKKQTNSGWKKKAEIFSKSSVQYEGESLCLGGGGEQH